ncbi:ATPase [Clostridium sp. DJ247]|uniref:ATPase n=1 Tax=Clostridium sp. DJ247 TaxID=2726188 RepID=UPI00162472AB|nr:ATPase [Clostridium sp. DJ247]MBC2579733.1 ATPase [Clostridium sp. DJ247]
MNIEEYWNTELSKDIKEDILNIRNEINGTIQRAYKYIGAAKLIHDNWSMYNRNALNNSKLSQLSEDLKNKIFTNHEIKDLGNERHLFVTAFVPDGIVTFIDDLCDDCEKIYVLNGGPGTGKTPLLKFIYTEALKRGFFVEVYHDALVPDKIEHIIIPELKTALISANEINGKKFNGTQIYLENFIDYSLINKLQLKKDKEMFYSLLNISLDIVSSTKKLYTSLETYCIQNINFNEPDEVSANIANKLLKYEKDCLEKQGLSIRCQP